MEDEVMKSNQPEQGNQTESQKPENIDSRLPYETPLLQKHGKVNDSTSIVNYDELSYDGFFEYNDLS